MDAELRSGDYGDDVQGAESDLTGNKGGHWCQNSWI